MRARNSLTMRVAGGDARGLRLKGAAVEGVRPTTERVRSAIFNILETNQVNGQRAVDLFAGTGSLGIEALSRGAAWADFVERNRRQCQNLQQNLETTGYAAAGQVFCADVLRWLNRRDETYGLVLLDPPYRLGDPTPVLEAMGASRLLAPDATLVVGYSSRRELPVELPGLQLYDSRKYGDNGVAFYRHRSP